VVLTKSPDPDANKRLAEPLLRAYRLADARRFDEAVALLTEYASSETSEMHRRIALNEMERIRGLSK
jgi:hypothetical protein